MQPIKKRMLRIPFVKAFKSMIYCGITTPSLPRTKWLNLDCFEDDIEIESTPKGVFVNGLKLDDWAQNEIDKITLMKVKRYFKTMIVSAIEAESLYQPSREKSLKAVKASQAKAKLRKGK
jgi:hypothetical protein